MFNTAASSSSFTSYPSSEMLSKREASTLCPTNAPLLTKESDDDLFDRRSSVQSLKYWMSKKQEIDGSVEKFLHLKQITTVPTERTIPYAKSTGMK